MSFYYKFNLCRVLTEKRALTLKKIADKIGETPNLLSCVDTGGRPTCYVAALIC